MVGFLDSMPNIFGSPVPLVLIWGVFGLLLSTVSAYSWKRGALPMVLRFSTIAATIVGCGALLGTVTIVWFGVEASKLMGALRL